MELFLLMFIIPIIVILGFVLPIVAVIDILKSRFSGNDNLLMLLIVLFIPFGAIIYFLIAPSKKIPNSTF